MNCGGLLQRLSQSSQTEKPFLENQDCIMLLHQDFKDKSSDTRVENLSYLKAECIISKESKTKWLHFLGKFRTVGHYMPFISKQRSAAVLTHPIHYSIYSSHFSLFLELHVEMVVVWSQSLKGSVDLTLKAKSSVLSRHRKWTSLMGCVSHSSNRPPRNLLVPTVSIRGYYQNQSHRTVQLRVVSCFAV